MRDSNLRDFLMLAHVYDPKKYSPCGWYMSEKLDGMRAFYDGGITRGIPCAQVPFANVEKHNRYREERVATGLWTRYGQPIAAPDSFLNKLPTCPLDGELHCGVGEWQKLVSIVKTLVPDERAWEDVHYSIFDLPSLGSVFTPGRINGTNFKKVIDDSVWKWVEYRATSIPERSFFASVYEMNQLFPIAGTQIGMLRQIRLPMQRAEADKMLNEALDSVLASGGEGVMLRDPSSFWIPKRSHCLLKVKAALDAEGTVVGYTWGEETDKGSKLLGLMGSMRLRLDSGLEFDLSGFTDAERIMQPMLVASGTQEGFLNPGKTVSDYFTNPLFPRGSRVTFKYRELSDGGLPKEARFWRRDDCTRS